MVTHNAIPSSGVPINASIMESMDFSDQNTELKMFGSTKKAYGDFCCVPRMFKSEGMTKLRGGSGHITDLLRSRAQTSQRLDKNDR